MRTSSPLRVAISAPSEWWSTLSPAHRGQCVALRERGDARSRLRSVARAWRVVGSGAGPKHHVDVAMVGEGVEASPAAGAGSRRVAIRPPTASGGSCRRTKRDARGGGAPPGGGAGGAQPERRVTPDTCNRRAREQRRQSPAVGLGDCERGAGAVVEDLLGRWPAPVAKYSAPGAACMRLVSTPCRRSSASEAWPRALSATVPTIVASVAETGERDGHVGWRRRCAKQGDCNSSSRPGAEPEQHSPKQMRSAIYQLGAGIIGHQGRRRFAPQHALGPNVC